MKSLIEMAKAMSHRQFIFITPQDVSGIKTDHMVEVLKLTAPDRSDVAGMPTQQTLEFASKSSN
jgi:hypothetical protein